MNRSTAQIYNGISILFIVLSLLVILLVVTQLGGGKREEASIVLPTPIGALPTLSPTSSFTPSNTPTSSSTPSNTPTPTNTEPATATITASATITPTLGPSNTPSITPTPSISATPIPSETSSVPTATFTATESPYSFGLNGDIFLGPNGVNSAGCAWQGVGGSVIGMDGVEMAQQFQVRVFGNGIERTVLTGSNSFYGATSGWEVVLDNVISPRLYIVRLETTLGTPLSPDFEVNFPGDCNANAAIVRFQQLRPLGPPAQPTAVGP